MPLVQIVKQGMTESDPEIAVGGPEADTIVSYRHSLLCSVTSTVCFNTSRCYKVIGNSHTVISFQRKILS